MAYSPIGKPLRVRPHGKAVAGCPLSEARIDLETRVRHALPVDLEGTARKGGFLTDVWEGRRDGHGRQQHIPGVEEGTEGCPVAFALRMQADELCRGRRQPEDLGGGKGIGCMVQPVDHLRPSIIKELGKDDRVEQRIIDLLVLPQVEAFRLCLGDLCPESAESRGKIVQRRSDLSIDGQPGGARQDGDAKRSERGVACGWKREPPCHVLADDGADNHLECQLQVGGGGALPFYFPGDGAVYRLSLVASEEHAGSNSADSSPSEPEHGLAWRGRDSALAATLARRKPRQTHCLHRASLWDFPPRRICHPDSCATPSAPFRSRLSTGRSSTFWAESLILISTHQVILIILDRYALIVVYYNYRKKSHALLSLQNQLRYFPTSVVACKATSHPLGRFDEEQAIRQR